MRIATVLAYDHARGVTGQYIDASGGAGLAGKRAIPVPLGEIVGWDKLAQRAPAHQ